MSRPFKLYRLQQIDTQLDWIKNRLSEIEAGLQGSEALNSAQQAHRQADERLQQARKAQRRAEDEVRQQRIKIEQNEASLYGGKIRNPKELKDLENEVASLKKHLAVLEDRQLESMLMEEEAVDATHLTENAVQKAQAAFDALCLELRHEQSKIVKDQARLEEERKAAAENVADEDLLVYNQLRKTRRGVAVSKIVDRACSACGSTLNSSLLSASHSPNALNLCDTCGRILYLG
jgi:predicted  nucleic acid-binding Zn-ribbon protein